MCKYANMGVVNVSTQKQAQIINKVLNSKTSSGKTQTQLSVTKTQFNANLWRAPKK